MTSSGRYARALRASFWLYIAAVVAVALQPSTTPSYLGRYSQTSLGLLLALLAGAAPVYFVLRWLAPRIDTLRLPPWLAGTAALGVGGVLGGLWALNLGTTPSYLFLRLGLSAMLVIAGLWSLERLRPAAGARWLLPLALVAQVGAVVWLARDFPGLLWTDEGFMASAAQGFIETGTTVLIYYRPIGWEALSQMYKGLGLWYAAFGFTFESGRLFILAVGLAAVVLTALAGWRAHGWAPAGLAALVTLVAVLNLNVYRQDIAAALLLGAAFLLFVLAEQTGRAWLHLLVGFCVGFSLDGHPSAYRFSLAFGAAYVFAAAAPMWRARRFIMDWRVLYLLLGGLAGVGLYIGLYFFGSNSFGRTAAQTPFIISPAEWPGALFSYAVLILRLAPLLLLPALFGLGVALRRREALDMLLLWTLGGGIVLLVVYPGLVRSYYVVHLLPVLMLLAARGFAALLDWLPEGQRAGVVGGLAALIAVASFAHMMQLKGEEPSQSYDAARPIGAAARALVPDEQRVVSADPMFFAFHDHPGFNEVKTATWMVARGSLSEPIAFWEDLAPDAVITIERYPAPYPEDLMAYVEREGFVSVACWQGHNLGRVDLLRRPEGEAAPPPPEECPTLP